MIRGVMLHLVTVACLTLAFAGVSSGQTCTHIPTPPNNDGGAARVIRTVSPTCSDVPTGAYIKVQTTSDPPPGGYRVHFAATSTGSCQLRINYCSPLPCHCENGALQLRTLATSTVYRNGTIIGYVTASGTPRVSPTTYDTSVPVGTTVTGFDWKPTTQGKFTFTSTINTDVTSCNLTPFSFAGTPYAVNVVKCKPDWLTDGNNNVVRMDTSGPITINVPASLSGLASSVAAAAADWENKTGFDVNVVNDTPCSGNRCATVESATLESCGYVPGGDTDSNGIRTGASVIQINGDWKTYSTDGLQRTFGHELGHLFGLNHASACAESDAAMHPAFNCAASPVMKDVTASDQLPVNSTSYGGGTRSTCGF